MRGRLKFAAIAAGMAIVVAAARELRHRAPGWGWHDTQLALALLLLCQAVAGGALIALVRPVPDRGALAFVPALGLALVAVTMLGLVLLTSRSPDAGFAPQLLALLLSLGMLVLITRSRSSQPEQACTARMLSLVALTAGLVALGLWLRTFSAIV
jgi:hypothetical protein